MLKSAQQVVDLEATKDKSLKKAPKLAKFNNVLDQILAEVSSQGAAFLETEGVLRLSGSKSQIDSVLEKMLGKLPADLSGDPSSTPLSSFPEFASNPHNLIGLLKFALRDYTISWSKEAQEEFEQFRQSNESNDDKVKMTFEMLIQNLINKKLYEEAKALHNILYLCYQVSSYSSKNKMVPSNIAIAIAPSIGPFFDLALDPQSTKLLQQMGQGFKHPVSQHEGGAAQFIKAVTSSAEPDYFSKPFSARNPEIAQKMAKEYDNPKKYPPLVKPVVFLGFKLPMWLSKIIRAITGTSPKARAVEAPKESVPDLPLQAKAQDETISASSVAPSITPRIAPVMDAPAFVEQEPERQKKSKKDHKREKPVMTRHKVIRDDLEQGLKRYSFKERQGDVKNKLDELESKKSPKYPKTPKTKK